MKKLLQLQKKCIAFVLFTCLGFTGYAQYDVIVAQDGSGNFTTVKAAIAAAPTGRTTPYRIFIKNGKYREKDTIPSNKPFIHLIGESVANVIISWDDFSGKPIPGGGTYGTSNSSTFFVNGNDFAAINITFENTTGEAPQALAINVTGDRAAFKNCRFLGGQDTVFDGGNGARHYYRNCYIDGTVDFIFGDGRAIFDSCVIYGKTRTSAGTSYITAANTKQTESYGYVFRDCQIPPNRGGTVYFLGRPWQNDAGQQQSYTKTIFLNATMSSAVHPAGWSTWDAGTQTEKITYAEYRTRKYDSTLINTSQRVMWSQQLSPERAAVYYNNDSMFTRNGVLWNACAVTPDFCTPSQTPIAVSNFRGAKNTNGSTSTFTWNISWPMAGIKYEILRSSDKTAFTKVSEQTSTVDSLINFTYTENVPPPGITYYYLVQASKAGYSTHITDTVVISSTPTINVAGTFGNFVQGVGTPSSPQSYVVSASSLTNNLIITAPAPYELSTNATTWNTSASPIVLTQNANGNIANTTIYVRLNGTSAGTYSGNVVHASQGADTVRLAVNGTIQSEPLTVSEILQWHPMAVNSSDSAAVRSVGVTASTPTFRNFSESNGIQYDETPLPAYSAQRGQALSGSPGGTGDWRTASGGPGGTLSRIHYEQFTVTAAAGYTLRVDSLVLNSSFYATVSNTRIGVVYSMSNFASDSSDITGGKSGAASVTFVTSGNFTKAVAVPQENDVTISNFRFALNGTTGVTLVAGQTLTVRLYFSCGSGSRNRYAKIKDLMFKGLSTKNPVSGDFRSKQTGIWTDVNTWERYNGTTWVHPAPEFPHFSNTSGTLILNGHIVTLASSFTEGFGYIPRRTRINTGGQFVINSGAGLNLANDGSTPPAATTDLQVDGTLTLNGTVGTNGNVAIAINGSFINTSTGMNLNNTGDTVFVGPNGVWQQNNNSNNTPTRLSFEPTSSINVTGLTSTQSGVFRNAVKYGNIIWNNMGETSLYQVRTTLDSTNVRGSFTVQSTGSTQLTFNQVSGRKVFPGGYYQTGGTVNFRESGTGTDTLDLGGDFSVTGGTFNSGEGAGSSLLVRLNGFNKTLTYAQSGATNTNWQVNGVYSLGSNLILPNAGFGVISGGTLNAGTFALAGAGDITLTDGATFSSGSPQGINGSITTTGTKNLSTAANYVFNGSTAQSTGTLLPATVNSLTINNATDITLSGSVVITGALTLTSGKLILGANTITAASVLGGTSARYVVTNGSGFLKMNNIGAGSNMFPVGPTTSSYNPVTLNNAGASDNFSVNVKTTFDNPVPDANKVVNRQWTINEDVTGGSNVTVSLSWTTADQSAGFDPASSISIIRYNSTTGMWENFPATLTGAGTSASPYVATATGITGFSPFTVINNSALPLNLLTFNAGYDNSRIRLTWSTAHEHNLGLFEVEKSADGRVFTLVSSVAPNNSSNYTLFDTNPLNGVTYYRLKMIDKDGTIRYGRIVVLNSRLQGLVSIYPNPAKNLVTLTHQKAKASSAVDVLTNDGRKVISQILEANSTQTSINVSKLSAGTYIVTIRNGDDNASITLVKQ